MSIDFKIELAMPIIETFGADMPIVGQSQTVRAIRYDVLMDFDNKDMLHDGVYELCFLKPTPFENMIGYELEDPDTGNTLIVGAQVSDNGYLITHEVNIK